MHNKLNNKITEDIIELTFHNDDVLETVLLEMLDNITFKRNKDNYIKNATLEYLKTNHSELYNKTLEAVKKRIDSRKEYERKMNNIFN